MGKEGGMEEMKCTQKGCNEIINIFAIAGFYHGPHHYRFARAICPVHGEIPLWHFHFTGRQGKNDQPRT